MRVRYLLIMLFLLLFSLPLPAEGFDHPYTLLDLDPQWAVGFGVLNDSFFGSGSAADWDDLRSFGFSGFISTPYNMLITADYASFTRRELEYGSGGFSRMSDVPADDARWDSLIIGLENRLYSSYWIGGLLTADILVDTEIYGDLGGLWIQQTVHSGFVNDRKIPEDYIDDGFRLSGGVRLANTFGRRFRFDQSLSTRIDYLLQGEISAAVAVTDRAASSRLSFGISFDAAWRTQEILERQLAEAYETGLNFRFGYQADYFTFSRTVNVLSPEGRWDGSYNSVGTMGFRYPAVQTSPYRRKGNFTIVQGIPVNDRMTVLFLWQGEWLWKFFPPITAKTSLYLGTGNGWGERPEKSSDPEIRFEDLIAGIRWQLFNPRLGWLPNLFLDTGLSLRREQFYRLGPYHAVPEHISYSLAADLRLGIDIPFLLLRNRSTEYSLQCFYGFSPILWNDSALPSDYGREPQYFMGLFGIAFTYRELNLFSEKIF